MDQEKTNQTRISRPWHIHSGWKVAGRYSLGLLGLLTLSLACSSARETAGSCTALESSRPWETQIREFEEEDRRHSPPQDAVLFIGSSSIRKWSELAADFPDIQVIHRGFGGSGISDCTFYLDRIVIPYRPRMIVLYAGENDIAGGRTAGQVFEDYKEFVTRASQALPRTRIAYISLKPSPSRVQHMAAFQQANELIRRYAAAHQRLSYIDVFTNMLGPDGRPRLELFVADGLHLNRKGYELWTILIADHLK
ncbi:MAG: hypothetical protein GXY44_03845 [Phycisphaerales bacterium]|nr:hypothetical protein [Phycisphaerales bacterium]